MQPNQYEQFVADVVNTFSLPSTATVFRNKRYRGVKQPGSYEIDIAVEFNIARALCFLLIIECKALARPVDRPAIQKLVQTRDAINANKAAVASLGGFTAEALSVARANGVACWSLDSDAFTVIIAYARSPDVVTPGTILDYLREQLFSFFQQKFGMPTRRVKWPRLPPLDLRPQLSVYLERVQYDREEYVKADGHTVVTDMYEGQLMRDLINAVIAASDHPLRRSLARWSKRYQSILRTARLSSAAIANVLDCVITQNLFLYPQILDDFAKANVDIQSLLKQIKKVDAR
jgi:hypothetical protein